MIMHINICTDCALAHAGYSAHEIGYDYSTGYQPLAMFKPTDCDTFYANTSEAKRWILSSVGCWTTTDGYETSYCPGHFSDLSCQGCGNHLAGQRYCYTATRVSTRVEA
jgi:hypothetical protein